MSQDVLGQLKHLKTARARWPFPDVLDLFHLFLVTGFVFYSSMFIFQSLIDLCYIFISLGQEFSNITRVSYLHREF